MRYLRSLYESEDNVDYNAIIDNLENIIKKFNSFSSWNNRNRLINGGGLSPEFKDYFYDLLDNDWELSISSSSHYVYLNFRKALRRDGLESEVNSVISIMTEIRDRFVYEGFDSKFIFYINGKAQQVQNPGNYRVPIYKYLGIGGSSYLGSYKGGIYSEEEYVYGKIDFYII